MESLANEMLELIFEHTDSLACLIQITEVSPRFNKIVSSSSRLMGSLEKHVKNQDAEAEKFDVQRRKWLWVKRFYLNGEDM